MARVVKSKELKVKLGDKVGIGASLFSKLKEADVNVVASSCYQIESEAYFSIVPDKFEEAQKVLDTAKLKLELSDVILVEMPNKTGAFASLLQEISELGVNVTSAYATTTVKNSALAVLKTTDDTKVLEGLDE